MAAYEHSKHELLNFVVWILIWILNTELYSVWFCSKCCIIKCCHFFCGMGQLSISLEFFVNAMEKMQNKHTSLTWFFSFFWIWIKTNKLENWWWIVVDNSICISNPVHERDNWVSFICGKYNSPLIKWNRMYFFFVISQCF